MDIRQKTRNEKMKQKEKNKLIRILSQLNDNIEEIKQTFLDHKHDSDGTAFNKNKYKMINNKRFGYEDLDDYEIREIFENEEKE